MPLHPDFDPMGNAIRDYFDRGEDTDIVVYSDVTEPDTIPVPFLFRKLDQMPALEQLALQECRGYVLDVGAGAGPHALELQRTVFFFEQRANVARIQQDLSIYREQGIQLFEKVWKAVRVFSNAEAIHEQQDGIELAFPIE